jgi:hypothetical protein
MRGIRLASFLHPTPPRMYSYAFCGLNHGVHSHEPKILTALQPGAYTRLRNGSSRQQLAERIDEHQRHSSIKQGK